MAKGDMIDSGILGSLLAGDNVYGFILDIQYPLLFKGASSIEC